MKSWDANQPQTAERVRIHKTVATTVYKFDTETVQIKIES